MAEAKKRSRSKSEAAAKLRSKGAAPDSGGDGGADQLDDFSSEKGLQQNKRRRVLGREESQKKFRGDSRDAGALTDTPRRSGDLSRGQQKHDQTGSQRGGNADREEATSFRSDGASSESVRDNRKDGAARREGDKQGSGKLGKKMDMFAHEEGEDGKKAPARKGGKDYSEARKDKRRERQSGKAHWLDRAVDVPAEYRCSRLIVKNLPPYITAAELKQKLSSLGGEITDVCLLRNERGKSRQCAFVGFKTQQQAVNVKEHFHETFIHTRKVQVSYALPRETPYASDKGTQSAAAGQHKPPGAKQPAAGAGKAAPPGTAMHATSANRVSRGSTGQGGNVVEEESVGARKAGVSGVRTRVVFGGASDAESSNDSQSDSESSAGDASATGKQRSRTEKAKHVTAETLASADADESLEDEEDDLAWLHKQSARATELLPEGGECSAAQAAKGGKTGDTHAASRGTANGRKGDDAAEADAHAADDFDLALLGSHGRLLIQNLPYATTVDELRALGEEYGEVAEAHLVVDEETHKPRGFGFVTFVFPEHAVAALSRVNGSIFQGRLLRALPARPDTKRERRLQLREEHRLARRKIAGSSYKARKLEQLVNQDTRFAEEKVWNLLYVSANSAADAVLNELQVDKADLILGGDKGGGKKGSLLKAGNEGHDMGKSTAAATVALMEAHLLNQTKSWIKSEGISLEAFERRGNNLLTAAYQQTPASSNGKTGETTNGSAEGARGLEKGGESLLRSRDTLIVKHLPTSHVDGADLLRLFERVGPLARFLLAPSKTVAIVQYEREKDAEVAFRRLAYRQYKGVPLFLEKAPVNVFVEREEEKQQARKAAAEEIRAAEIADRVVGDGPSPSKAEKRRKRLAGREERDSAASASAGEAKKSSRKGASAAEAEQHVARAADRNAAPPARQQLAVTSAKKLKVDAIPDAAASDAAAEDLEESVQGASLFVKNVNFATSEAALNQVFSRCEGLRRTKLMTKKRAVSATCGNDNGDGGATTSSLSMGYAFVEFDSAANALAACKRMQGVVVDAHALQISISKAAKGRRSEASSASSGKTPWGTGRGGVKSKAQTHKVLVRNLAFQASASDLRALFSAYGNVTRVCIPRQHEGRSRGFGFVDFATRQEAQNALDGLSGSHLYGRRLVLEPAKQDEASSKMTSA
ncbi:RNA recognition motif-containing protein [Besnoitia besnoiti]|uniref:RNA recognition motif-containing protein n=1 Tax=Besnoitia besnoiti TaxID=94643 RepID=A0A2A9MLD7_BESBE|nr:RNA recognition motif-containing protein [Besnoitia besnoiti]PFH36270.1 RNA recognition motif-containing protein [Besnoitia besnoiti]